ncbi:hypothetical protein BG015_006929 [Linnemannia schmuckeri]|uniref:Uncharacterized protein n=1 Tax=Linnemannia schmuckeri TaxID=64567 RepID=A0A9P5RZJ9_9FUNG|nr:hypothetical protein BG015_006929 [Linnemannia schmuckeri]
MPSNLRLFLQLPRHSDHAATSLPNTLVSYDELPFHVHPPPLQDQLVAVQVQLGALTIGAAQGQGVEQDNSAEDENMSVHHVDCDFEFEEEKHNLQQQHSEDFENDLFFSIDDVLEFKVPYPIQLPVPINVECNVVQDQFQALAITIQCNEEQELQESHHENEIEIRTIAVDHVEEQGF